MNIDIQHLFFFLFGSSGGRERVIKMKVKGMLLYWPGFWLKYVLEEAENDDGRFGTVEPE